MKVKLQLTLANFRALNNWLLLLLAKHGKNIEPIDYLLLEELSIAIMRKLMQHNMAQEKKLVKVTTNLFALHSLALIAEEHEQGPYLKMLIAECQKVVESTHHQLEAHRNARISINIALKNLQP